MKKTAGGISGLGFNREAILVTPHPYLELLAVERDILSEQSLTDLRAQTFGEEFRERKLITFCSELSSGLDEEGYSKTDEYTLNSPGSISTRSDVVTYNFMREAMEILRGEGFLFDSVLRLHPKQDSGDSLLSGRFDLISQKEESLQVCRAHQLSWV